MMWSLLCFLIAPSSNYDRKLASLLFTVSLMGCLLKSTLQYPTSLISISFQHCQVPVAELLRNILHHSGEYFAALGSSFATSRHKSASRESLPKLRSKNWPTWLELKVSKINNTCCSNWSIKTYKVKVVIISFGTHNPWFYNIDPVKCKAYNVLAIS